LLSVTPSIYVTNYDNPVQTDLRAYNEKAYHWGRPFREQVFSDYFRDFKYYYSVIFS
jgi:hypothetical protein